MASLARENADRNGFQDRLRIVEADFAASSLFAGAGPLAGRTFDHACANPPFFERGRVREAGNPGKAGAHAGAPGLIGDWASHLVGAVRPGGTVTMILPPAALEEVLAGLRRRAGGISLYPLYPRAGTPATRLLIQAVNGSRAPLRIHAGMVLHEADGAPTGEAEAILRHGRAIEALALGDLG
jgi:tRNA1(Val) A37 N6-methylase TrmN6